MKNVSNSNPEKLKSFENEHIVLDGINFNITELFEKFSEDPKAFFNFYEDKIPKELLNYLINKLYVQWMDVHTEHTPIKPECAEDFINSHIMKVHPKLVASAGKPVNTSVKVSIQKLFNYLNSNKNGNFDYFNIHLAVPSAGGDSKNLSLRYSLLNSQFRKTYHFPVDLFFETTFYAPLSLNATDFKDLTDNFITPSSTYPKYRTALSAIISPNTDIIHVKFNDLFNHITGVVNFFTFTAQDHIELIFAQITDCDHGKPEQNAFYSQYHKQLSVIWKFHVAGATLDMYDANDLCPPNCK